MAFGFLKKIVALVTGKDSGKKKKNGAKFKAHSSKTKQKKSHQKKNASPRNNNESRNQDARKNDRRKNNAQSKFDRRDNHSAHYEKNSQKHSSKKSSQTPVNMMRPGGEVSAKERAARKEAHEKWDPATFVVEAIEGKKRFHDFDLPSEVMHGIAELGFKYCTEIQALSLEQALAGKNIAGKAQTGSGKTAAFLVSILTRYLRTPEKRAKTAGAPRALVIAPTRELVIQICQDADAIGKYCHLRCLAVYGGMDYDRQKQEILDAPVDLIVATPGRLLDFAKSRVLNLSDIDTLVIDEADRMLDMGFIPDVRRIMSYLPAKDKRATMLYSATLNDTVMRLALNWMEEPFKAEVASETNATDTVKQVVYVVRSKDKFTVLFNHIALHPESRVIVFCNRKTTTEKVYDALLARGVSVDMLSGDVNQNRRLKVLADFRANKIKVVVATDVAGRGIDIKGLEYVINFDFPYEAEDYVHRIGRTGRAGSTGVAISFADEDESFAIPEIEAYIKEPLKCTMIQEDDPLLKEVPPRGTKLTSVDADAKAEVDAREAVGEDEKAAAAAITGANAITGRGAPALLRSDAPQRVLPSFANACEEKKPMTDESDAYSKPVEQTSRFSEWQV